MEIITENEYIEALKIVRGYRDQLNTELSNIDSRKKISDLLDDYTIKYKSMANSTIIRWFDRLSRHSTLTYIDELSEQTIESFAHRRGSRITPRIVNKMMSIVNELK